MASPGNWMHLQYQSRLQARKALSKDGKVFGDAIMVGVKPCIDKVSTCCYLCRLIGSSRPVTLSSTEGVSPSLSSSECDGQQRSCFSSHLLLLLLLCPPLHPSLCHQTAQRCIQELRRRLPGDLQPLGSLWVYAGKTAEVLNIIIRNIKCVCVCVCLSRW